MSGQLTDKIALITGGGSGIGRATALAFAREGAQVVVADRDIPSGQMTVTRINDAGGEATFIETDISRAEAVESMVSRVIEAYGRIDCAFNNAGVADPVGTSFVELEEEAWDRVIGINLTGVWLCMKYEIQQMLKQDSGAIVNTASTLALVGGPIPAYTASKHGVVGLTKSAALTYAQDGIRVNAVCPGFIDTPLLAPYISDPDVEAGIVARHPIGRLGTPEEVAETVVWLCSDAASFVTGHALAVDGGYLAQ